MKYAWLAMFEETLTGRERKLWMSLSSPSKIQAFLDTLPYSTHSNYRYPLRVLRERTAHCFDGALFAAAALRRLGHSPRLVYMTAQNDDDHLIAVYQKDRYWGAVAKSNFSTMRFRESVYRTLRELVMSYFDGYFNVKGERTLRGYTVPLDLRRFDRYNWMTSDQALDLIDDRLNYVRHVSLLTHGMMRRLSRVDRLSYRAGMLGVNPRGLYKP